MSFRQGTLSYARFRVAGSASSPLPREVDDRLLERLAENTLRSSGIGEPQQAEFGFCAGRHVFDDDFSPEQIVFGQRLLFGVRVDTNRVPAEIRRAYRAMAEQSYRADSETGALSRRERLAAKEDAEERCRRELAEGRYRRSKVIDVLWDLESDLLYAPAFSDALVAGLRDLFERAFNVQLQAVSSGPLAYEMLDAKGRSRDYEDLKPTAFGPRPAGPVDADDEADDAGRLEGRPPVPWTHAGAEASDFLGNEFLLWLWWTCAACGGVVETARGDVLMAIDRSLEMECAWDVAGRMSLHASGPGRLPEARSGLQNGKWPRKAGLIVAAEGEQFEVNLQADRFVCGGVRLPRPSEEVASEREFIEHRLDLLATLDRALVDAYRAFLDVRCGGGWTASRERIAAWIAGRAQRGGTASTAIEVKQSRDVAAAAPSNGVAP